MISVVIPVYNEELAIKGNIAKLVNYLRNLNKDWELILVNDGSTDDTLDIMQGISIPSLTPNIKIVSYKKNRGRGFALKTGFKKAKGLYIIATESDLNWGTEIIGRFVEELEKDEADIIIASPHMKGGHMENVPFARWLLSYLGNIIFSFALPGHLTMSTGMTRGYKREVLESLDLESEGKEMHIEILYKAFDLGYRVKEIPAILEWKKPKPGEVVRRSHFKFSSILKHLLLSLSVRPFILFGGGGSLFFFIGAITGVYLLKLSLSGIAVSGRPLLVFSILMMIVGLQVIIFGFLANQGREIKKMIVRTQRDLRRTYGTKS